VDFTTDYHSEMSVQCFSFWLCFLLITFVYATEDYLHVVLCQTMCIVTLSDHRSDAKSM